MEFPYAVSPKILVQTVAPSQLAVPQPYTSLADCAVPGLDMPQRMERGFWKDGFLKSTMVVISTALGLALFLLGDRLYSDRVLKTAQPSMRDKCSAAHENRHHALMRRCSGKERWGKVSFPVFTNNLGLRDAQVREVPMDPGHRARILFVGDSFTFDYRAWEDTFVGMVSAALPDYDVLNAGIPSYSPSTYYLIVRELLETGVAFDELIVFLDISDVQDEASFYVDGPEGTVTSRSTSYRHQDASYARIRGEIGSRWLLTDEVYSFVEGLLIKAGVFWLPRPYYGDIFDTPRGAWTYRSVPEGFSMPDGYDPLGIRGGIQREGRKLDQLFKLVYDRGIPFSVAVYPWPGQLKHDDLESIQVSIWQAWCEGRCKRFINLFPDFFSEMRKCPWLLPGCWYERLYVFGDFHFTTYGNTVVARRLVEELSRTPVPRVTHTPERSSSEPRPASPGTADFQKSTPRFRG